MFVCVTRIISQLGYPGIGVWTTALAGVMLRANVTVVSDYMDVAATVLLAAAGVMMARRCVRCWRTS